MRLIKRKYLICAFGIVMYIASCSRDNLNLDNEINRKPNDSLAISDSVSLIYRNNGLHLFLKGRVVANIDLPYGDSLIESLVYTKYCLFYFKSKRVVIFNSNSFKFGFPIDSILKQNVDKINFIDDVAFREDGNAIEFSVFYLSNLNMADSLIYKWSD